MSARKSAGAASQKRVIKRRRMSRAQLLGQVGGLKNSSYNGLMVVLGLIWIVSSACMAVAILGALAGVVLGVPLNLSAMLMLIIVTTAAEGLLRLFDRARKAEWFDQARYSGLSPEEAKALWDLGKATNRWKESGGPPPAADFAMTLYLPVGQPQLAQFRKNGWTLVPPTEHRSFYLTSSYEHARDMARSWYANGSEVGIGFVVKLKLKAAFVAGTARHEFGPKHREEYWSPADQIDALNEALIAPPKQAAVVRSTLTTEQRRAALAPQEAHA